MYSSNLGFQSKFAALCITLTLMTLWLALHGYHGLTGDGQIYAFQAVAKLHPPLTTDLYLQNTSQDQFTLFSPLYAWCIGSLGLENAARLLTLSSTLWLLAATWSFAHAITGREAAWLAVALLLIIAGNYGGAGVLRVLDPFLTARLPAEALTITALGCYVRGWKRLGLLLALAALFIHPLLALPGLLLLVCLCLPVRVSVSAAIGGVVATFVVAVVALKVPTASPLLTVMDAPWLEVVQERSQFLFLQLWSIHDWEVNARPFIYLGFTAIAVTSERIRKLCTAAALVGAVGLAVALIGGLVGPVAIVVQGQAWRWVWITVFISVVLVPFTILQVWPDKKCGWLCTLLLASGWALPDVEGTACVSLALLVWLTRAHINSRLATQLRWVSAALGTAIAVWGLIQSCAIVSPSAPASGHASLSVAQIQDMFALKIPAVLFGALVWRVIKTSRTAWGPLLVSTVLAAFSVLVFAPAFTQAHTLGAAADIEEFADWRNVIPSTSTVLVAPSRDVGGFVWFTLGRPNYLALDQSAGVVYSRVTALEVRRRSDVLLPIKDPDWKILTSLQTKSPGEREKAAVTRPLTVENLIQVCADPQLGFVVSSARVGFDPLRHVHAGPWKDWNLYDCRTVRSVSSPT